MIKKQILKVLILSVLFFNFSTKAYAFPGRDAFMGVSGGISFSLLAVLIYSAVTSPSDKAEDNQKQAHKPNTYWLLESENSDMQPKKITLYRFLQ